MAKSERQKWKMLTLRKLLLEQTDPEHPLSVQALCLALAEAGIPAERKSVYNDLETLRETGLDVHCRKAKPAGWYVEERDLPLSELKLLVDAVQTYRFLTTRKCEELVGKLEKLASVHQAPQLRRQVYVNRRIKNMREGIGGRLDNLHAALDAEKMVSFHYFKYDVQKARVYRREGKRYTVVPKGIIWDNDNCYLVGLDEYWGELRHFRVDRMSELVVTGYKTKGKAPRFDVAAYAAKHFGMYGGREGKVRLQCGEHLVGVVMDHFGPDVELIPREGGSFSLVADAVVSAQFWGWLFGLGTEVELLGPDWAVEEYRRRLREVKSLYDVVAPGHIGR